MAGPDQPHSATPPKRDSAFFSTRARRAAQANAQRHAWAADLRADAAARADRFLAAGVERLWRMVTPQSLPRSYAVNQEAGSPVTGTRLHAYGRYPWLADPLARPWKLEDPSSGYLFPTNDFGAYYESGIGQDGLFDPALADRSLLVNTLYPERGPDWGVDDGFGWRDPDGRIWTFIAYYVHWWLWYRSEDTGISSPVIWDALDAFREAWVFTGDVRYAHAGLVLLDRVADVYPAMDTATYARADGFLHSDGLRGAGGITGGIWETQLVQPLINAYDAFQPLLRDADPAGVVPFLSAQARRYGMANLKASPDDIRDNIEQGIIRRIYPMVVAGRIRGNFGMHQHALARAAAALADPVDTPAWVDFLNRPGTYGDRPTPRLSGGNVLPALVNDIDRDGFGNEAAPHYNYLWLDQMLGLATTLDAIEDVPGANLFAHPRLRTMLNAWPRLVMIGRYTPTIGDTPKTGNPFIRGAVSHYVAAFQRWGDPLYAQFAWLLNGNTAEGLRGDVLSDNPGEVGEEIASAVREYGPLAWRSDNLTGYGLGILRDHVPGHERSLWLYYGRNRGHGHADALNLGLHAFGIDLSPDLGYPEYADDNPKRKEWTINTISHNTVVVNRRTQDPVVAGTPLLFLDTPGVQAIEVDAAQAYAETSVYRRASVMVRIDDETSYIVDIVRVHGGDDHHLSFHGAEGTVTTDGLGLVPQDGGSYAGPDIPWGPAPDPATAASGFTWLDRVERDMAPPAVFSVDWAITDTWGVLAPDADVHLRLTMLGDVDDVALADGYPATNQVGNPERLRYLIAHRHGRDLRSRFVSVIEPYAVARRVRAISALPVESAGGHAVDDVTAVRVETAAGRIDTIIHCGDVPGRLIVDGRIAVEGRLAVISEHADGTISAVLEQGSALFLDGTPLIDDAIPAWTGHVVDFTREMQRDNTITVRFDHEPDLAALSDAWIAIDHDGDRNAVYRIVSATDMTGGDVALGIGSASLIRAYTDPLDMEQGFAYDIAPGAPFRIPLHHIATR